MCTKKERKRLQKFQKQIGVALKIKVVDVCIKRWMFVLRATDLNNLIQIIWICMLHKRSAESAKSKMPVFSRRILGSAKARKSGSYLSSLTCTELHYNMLEGFLYQAPESIELIRFHLKLLR